MSLCLGAAAHVFVSGGSPPGQTDLFDCMSIVWYLLSSFPVCTQRVLSGPPPQFCFAVAYVAYLLFALFSHMLVPAGAMPWFALLWALLCFSYTYTASAHHLPAKYTALPSVYDRRHSMPRPLHASALLCSASLFISLLWWVRFAAASCWAQCWGSKESPCAHQLSLGSCGCAPCSETACALECNFGTEFFVLA